LSSAECSTACEWEDSKRLDWLDSECGESLHLVEVEGVEVWVIDGFSMGTRSLREAIDRAREYVWVDMKEEG
jgi:hypothetical protein